MTETGHAPIDPVRFWLAGGQEDGHDKVGGVTSGGQGATSGAGLVHWKKEHKMCTLKHSA